MMRTAFIATALIVSLSAQASTLNRHSQLINEILQNATEDYLSRVSMTMENGATVILNENTGQQYYLNPEQVEQFNAAYAEALAVGVVQEDVAIVMQDAVIEQQEIYSEAKDDLIESAGNIAAVTALADELAEGGRASEIDQYASDNDLTEIKDEDVQTFNTSIDAILVASRTKNMIEAYGQDVQLAEKVSYEIAYSGQAEQFISSARVSIDELNPAGLNIAWGDQSLTVESEMYHLYSDTGQWEEYR